MSEVARAPTIWAMVGLVVAILGWLITQAGFNPITGEPVFEVSHQTRMSLRYAGVAVMFSGLVLAGLARLRVPLGIFAAGITLNLAAEAGVVTPHHLGIVGVIAALAGSLWASRQVREGMHGPPDE